MFLVNKHGDIKEIKSLSDIPDANLVFSTKGEAVSYADSVLDVRIERHKKFVEKLNKKRRKSDKK